MKNCSLASTAPSIELPEQSAESPIVKVEMPEQPVGSSIVKVEMPEQSVGSSIVKVESNLTGSPQSCVSDTLS